MHEEKEAGTAALTFEEFRKRITDDYFTAFLSCRLAFLKNHRSLIRNNDVRLLDFGRELVHLTLEKVIKDNDFIADDSKGAGYVVGLAGTTKLAENDVIKDFNGLKISGGEIVHWIISRKSLPPGHVIDAFNAAAELKLPLSLTIIEETDELLPVDDRISMHFMNKLLNEISLTENIYQCEAGDYAGLCRIFEEGTGVCRKQKVPVLFHIRQNTSAGNAELSDAVLSMRHWIIQIRLATSGEIEKLEHQADRKAEEIRKKAARECMRLGIKLI